jgi:hypothetical protein
MSAHRRLRSRLARISLRRKLPLAFAGVALLTMVVLGVILIPLVDGHYARSEVSYLKAAAEQAAAGLSTSDWRSRKREARLRVAASDRQARRRTAAFPRMRPSRR